MPTPELIDLRSEPTRAAEALGVSREALELYLASDVIDLHIDSFIWTRLFGYDLHAPHAGGLFGGRLYGQVDLPRVHAAHITGAMWSITTNPLRSAKGRARALAHNLSRLRSLLAADPEVRVVRNASEYRAARAAGQHGAFIALQGGNALDADSAPLGQGEIVRVTLVHMTSSQIGATSSPLAFGRDAGLHAQGKQLIERLNAARVFVDLAHIGRRSFFDALELCDPAQPVIVTHTGVSGVQPSWRNLDDEQIRRVADSGGVIGVIFHGEYLSGRLGGGAIDAVVAHLAHIARVAGEHVAALGSDWDGAIIPPRALRSCSGLPRLVQALLDAGFTPEAIRGVLGQNFLRSLARLRP